MRVTVKSLARVAAETARVVAYPQGDIRVITAALSALLSVWAFFVDDALNGDGILYLDVAYQITLGEWGAAYQLYPWPFYPALIAGVYLATPLDITAAAALVNTTLYALVAYLLLTVVKLCGGGGKVMLACALLFLIHPYLNEQRENIVRGPGMWVALLAATICLIRLKQSGKLVYAHAWSVSLIIGALFRIEALVFMAVGPMILLFDRGLPRTTRVKAFAACYIIPALVLAAFFALQSAAPTPIGRLDNPGGYLRTLFKVINEERELLTAQGFRAVFDAVKFTTIPYLALAAFQVIKNRAGNPARGGILVWLACVNLNYVIVHALLAHEGLAGRYTAPLTLIVVIYAAYGLVAAWERCAHARAGAVTKAGLIAVLLTTAAYGFVNLGTDRPHIRAGGKWLFQNMSPDAYLVTNDLAVRHSAGQINTPRERALQWHYGRELRRGEIPRAQVIPGDYIAVRARFLNRGAIAKLDANPDIQRVQTFRDGARRELLVYRVLGVKERVALPHLRVGGEWLAQNMPQDAYLATNDSAIKYRVSGIRTPRERSLQRHHTWDIELGGIPPIASAPGDYIAARTKYLNDEAIAKLDANPDIERIKTFGDGAHRELLVYRVLTLAGRVALPHLRAGGKWLARNMPQDAYLATNDLAIKHSAGKRITPRERALQGFHIWKLERGEIPLAASAPGDYIAARTKYLNDETIAKLDANPDIERIKTFGDGAHRELLVYRVLALAERATALPHLRAGVEWLAENMPPDTYLFTNDLAIKHSVGGRITPTERGFLTRDVARIMRGEVPPIAATPGSTIAIRIRPLHFADEVSKKLDNNPAIRWVKTFVGEGEKLLVYRVLATKDGE